MRISDWSSDVCSSDLLQFFGVGPNRRRPEKVRNLCVVALCHVEQGVRSVGLVGDTNALGCLVLANPPIEESSDHSGKTKRPEEHTSELPSLMPISYLVFCIHKKIQTNDKMYSVERMKM